MTDGITCKLIIIPPNEDAQDMYPWTEVFLDYSDGRGILIGKFRTIPLSSPDNVKDNPYLQEVLHCPDIPSVELQRTTRCDAFMALRLLWLLATELAGRNVKYPEPLNSLVQNQTEQFCKSLKAY